MFLNHDVLRLLASNHASLAQLPDPLYGFSRRRQRAFKSTSDAKFPSISMSDKKYRKYKHPF